MLFAAGALGELFSLTQQEFVDVIRTAVDTCHRKTPIIASAGGPTRVAIAYAQEAGGDEFAVILHLVLRQHPRCTTI